MAAGLDAWLDGQVRPLLERLQLLGRAAAPDAWTGRYRARQKGRSLEYAGFREYVPGDDPRTLDWQALARLDRPFVREYTAERERVVTVLIDGSASMAAAGKVATALQLAAALGYCALYHGDRWQLVLLQGPAARLLGEGRGRGARHRLAVALAAAEAHFRTVDTPAAAGTARARGGAAAPDAATVAGGVAGIRPPAVPQAPRWGDEAEGLPGSADGTRGWERAVTALLPALKQWRRGAIPSIRPGGGVAILISDLLDPASLGGGRRGEAKGRHGTREPGAAGRRVGPSDPGAATGHRAAPEAGEAGDGAAYVLQVVSLLAAAGQGVLLHLLAPPELGLEAAGFFPPPGEWTLVDAETGAALDVTVDGRLLEAYRRALAGWLEGWRRACHAHRVLHVPVPAPWPLRGAVMDYLVPAGVLG